MMETGEARMMADVLARQPSSVRTNDRQATMAVDRGNSKVYLYSS